MPWISKDYEGMKFGKWTVISRDLTKKRPPKYLCKCECGHEKINFLYNLTRGLSTQCPTCQAKCRSQHLIGKRHGFLTVIDNPKINGKTKLHVKCDCGNTHYIPRLLGYKSCGKCHLTKNRKQKVSTKIGKKYGLLTVLEYDKETRLYKCQCACGKIINIEYYKLRNDHPSCGCYWKNVHVKNAKKLEGLKYHYLKIIKFIGMGEDKRARYQVKCKCGKKFEQSISHLFGSKSCGCLHKENVAKGENNHLSKLTENEVISMRELYKCKYYNIKHLAEIYEISYAHACSVIKKRSWKHL